MAIAKNPPAGVTPAIARAWADVHTRWGDRVDNLGTTACRRIFGRPPPAPWSEHAWGNAWDIGGERSVLDAVARYLARRPYVAQVLWRRRDLVSGASVEDHDWHVHVSGRPLRSTGGAVPPCAGGERPGIPGPHAPRRRPLPAPLRTVAGESWAPVAHASARELLRIARRASRVRGALRDIMRRR